MQDANLFNLGLFLKARGRGLALALVVIGAGGDVGSAFAQAVGASYAVSTIAGMAPLGNGPEEGELAEVVFGATSIATGRNGLMYVSCGSSIQKISTKGVVTVLAGNPNERGSNDGAGRSATFGSALALACGPSGDIFVLDRDNYLVRRVTEDGIVTTLAGKAGAFGNKDGSGENVRFGNAWDLAVDSQGNVFFTDTSWACIRKVAPDGTATTFAGKTGNPAYTDGFGQAAGFYIPYGIAVDPSDNLYVGDSDGSHGILRKITPKGLVSTLAGNVHASNPYAFADGPGTLAQFSRLYGLVADAKGNVYAADYNNRVIRKVAADGTTTTLAGSPYAGGQGSNDGTGQAARFNAPVDLTLDSAGNLYIADPEDRTLRKLSPDGVVTTYAGIRPSRGQVDGVGASARFYMPSALTLDVSGNLFVSDSYNGIIRKVTTTGIVTTLPLLNNDLVWPLGLAFDKRGNLYVADSYNLAVRKITPGGVMTKVADLRSMPIGLVIDSAGNTFVSQSSSIVKITPSGGSSLFAGGMSGSVDGTGASAGFDSVYGLAVDGQDNIYAADYYGQAIRKITPAGVVTTIAGQLGKVGRKDGPRQTALLEDPTSVAVDASGTVYFTERFSGAIRRVTPDGTVTTVARDAYQAGGVSILQGPAGIVVDSHGRLYISNSGENTIIAAVEISAPSITVQPQSVIIAEGRTVTLSVTASGNGLNYQWRKNGLPLTGNSTAATSVFTIITVTPVDAATYDCVVTNDLGSVTSVAARVTVVPPSSRFINIATRAYASTDNGVTIGGFVITGSAPKQVLIRGVGPSLIPQGISASEALLDPVIELHRGSETLATNDNWGENTNAGAITTAATRVGATPLDASDTKSAALLMTLDPGIYSFIAKGKNYTSGIVLLEVYDADSGGSIFVNIATRVRCTTNNGAAIGGFVISGNSSKQVLLRAVGPTLLSFGLSPSEVLLDPTIELHQGPATVATNDDWGTNANAAEITSAGARIGAAAFAPGDTKSSGMLITLQPGVYSFVVKGKNETSGVVLVEVYDAD